MAELWPDKMAIAQPKAAVGLAELQLWLEWAGAKLLALPGAGAAPKDFRVAWPDFPANKNLAYGYTATKLRPPPPAAAEIEVMDEILLLPGLIPNILQRRVVNARSLVRPISGQYLYSWSKIGLILHMDRSTVRRLHTLGLKELAIRISSAKVYRIRSSLQ